MARVTKHKSPLTADNVGVVTVVTEDVGPAKRGARMQPHPKKYLSGQAVLRYRRYHCAYQCIECGMWHGNGNGRWADFESPRDHLAKFALTHIVRED